MRRFLFIADAAGKGELIDLDTGRPEKGVRAVAVVAKVGEATRVIVEYVAEVEVEAVEVEAGPVEVPPVRPRQSVPGRAAGGRARAAALSPERRRQIARDAALARWRGHLGDTGPARPTGTSADGGVTFGDTGPARPTGT